MIKPASWLLLLSALGCQHVLAQIDTIVVAGKAATLVTCRHTIKAVQVESEHPWFVTQLVGKVAMIRAAGIPPIALNAVVITTKKIYPVVILYNAATATETKRCRIPEKRKSRNRMSSSNSWQQLLAQTSNIVTNDMSSTDTAGIYRISANFLQEAGKLHCTTKLRKITAGLVRGMKLDGRFYFHLRMVGKSSVPAEIEAVRVLTFDTRTKILKGVPLLLRMGNSLIPKGQKAAMGLVIPALMLDEEIIWIAIKLRNIPPPLIVKIRRKNLPGYMLEPDFS
ncbi:hypothetical protein [Chitinophaga sp. sic0106]|uniref:hypothetical protein n=1 Tax=Chitinophaga sp. sic0106 TaxID=2854785 RepID=UPI001C455902|nr:hypothetical protein [Chitinophaga sp. sic0106]MBV7532260.1 hypothetical protein [Chitinophaga sp. sic0106]